MALWRRSIHVDVKILCTLVVTSCAGFDVGLHEHSPKHALKKVLECTIPIN